jgi:elongation factor 1-beta
LPEVWLHRALRWMALAKVKVLYKIMPEEAEKGVEEIERLVRDASKDGKYEVVGAKVEDIGFGIKALYVLISLAEEEGLLEEVEEKIRCLENVGSLEVEGISRI